MEPTERDLRKLLDDVAVRERRAYKRSFVIILIPVFIGMCLIVLAFLPVKRLRAEKDQLKSDITNLNQQKSQKVIELEEKTNQVKTEQARLDRFKQAVAPFTNDDPGLAAKVSEVIDADVSISIQQESQRAKANQVARELRTKGYMVYRIKLEVIRGPNTMQVRYFRWGKPGEAVKIAEILRGMGFTDAYDQYIEGLENSPTSGEYQIFFGHP